MLVTAGGHDRSLMTWRVKSLRPPQLSDPELLENEGQLMEAKKVWYYKYTGQEWSGEEPMYVKYENIYNGKVGPNEPGKAEKAAAKALEGGGEGRPSTAPANLNSASAAELQSTIKKQETELQRQQKLIEDLQAKLQAR